VPIEHGDLCGCEACFEERRQLEVRRTFATMQSGPNPMSKDDLDRLIQRNPARYGCLRGALDN
jgi:hypothetical protein